MKEHVTGLLGADLQPLAPHGFRDVFVANRRADNAYPGKLGLQAPCGHHRDGQAARPTTARQEPRDRVSVDDIPTFIHEPAAIAVAIDGEACVCVMPTNGIRQVRQMFASDTIIDDPITATNDGSRMFKFNGGTTLDEIVHAVTAVGAAPGDLIAILEALKQAGALSAELEVI
jgi:hypothetical protein